MWKVKRVSATARVSARVSARLYATFQPRSRFLFFSQYIFRARALYVCACEGEGEGHFSTSISLSLSLSAYFAYSACLGLAIWENATEGIVGGEKNAQAGAREQERREFEIITSPGKVHVEEEEEEEANRRKVEKTKRAGAGGA